MVGIIPTETGRSQHYTHRDHDAELPSNSPFSGLIDCFDRNQRLGQSRSPSMNFSFELEVG